MRTLVTSLAAAIGLVASWAGEPVPDFKLVDMSPNSSRSGAHVSPRDYRLQVSGYYFGDAG